MKKVLTVAVLGVIALIGIAAAIPTSLTSLIVSGVAVIGIVAALITSVLR